MEKQLHFTLFIQLEPLPIEPKVGDYLWSQRHAIRAVEPTGCPTGKEDGFPPSSFPIYFEYHPQVEPTEEVAEGKAAEVFSIEVKESKPVARKKVGSIELIFL